MKITDHASSDPVTASSACSEDQPASDVSFARGARCSPRQSERSASPLRNARHDHVEMQYLKLPLHMLGSMRDVSRFNGLQKAQVASLNTHYSKNEVDGIVQALRVAQDKPDYDLKSLRPDLPHSNVEMHQFLGKVLTSIDLYSESPKPSSSLPTPPTSAPK